MHQLQSLAARHSRFACAQAEPAAYCFRRFGRGCCKSLAGSNEARVLGQLYMVVQTVVLFVSFVRSWCGITSPFESGLGFAFLVFVTEAVALPDLTSSQLSEYFARVRYTCMAP